MEVFNLNHIKNTKNE